MGKAKYIVFFMLLVMVSSVAALIYFFVLKPEKTFEYGGKTYKEGEAFPSDDGCNTCSFDKNGELQCTLMACNDNDPLYEDSVDITFEYFENKYEYTAIIQKPTPCDTITVDTVIRESFPEQVDLNIKTETSGGICIQVIAEEEIEGEIQVSKDAVIDVYFNGELVEAAGNK